MIKIEYDLKLAYTSCGTEALFREGHAVKPFSRSNGR